MIVKNIKGKKLTVYYSGKEVHLPREYRDAVESNWQKVLTKQPHLFNGDVYSVTDMDFNTDEVAIKIDRTNFAHYRYRYTINDPQDPHQAKNFFASVLIETSDNNVVFGRMGAHTNTVGKIQPIGGVVDNNDVRENTVDVAACAKRELLEEVGIDVNNDSVVKDCEHHYIKDNPGQGVGVIYRASIAMTSAAFQTHFDAFSRTLHIAGETPEFAGLIFVPKTREGIDAFFEKHKNDHMQDYVEAILPLIVDHKSVKNV